MFFGWAIADEVLPGFPAAPVAMLEPLVSTAFGQRISVPLERKNCPIKVLSSAFVPLQAVLMIWVRPSKNSIQALEHGLPLLKSVAEQAVKGVS